MLDAVPVSGSPIQARSKNLRFLYARRAYTNARPFRQQFELRRDRGASDCFSYNSGMKKLFALGVLLLLGVGHGNTQSAEGYLIEQYGRLSEATITEFHGINGRYVAANVTTGRTLEAVVVLESSDGVQPVLRLDEAVYEFDGPSHHTDAYRRYFTHIELIDSNDDGVPEILLVSGCECAPAVTYSIIVDLETFDALNFGVLAWYDELPSGEYRDYTPLIETINPSSNRIAAMQMALVSHLENTRFPATLNPLEAYPTDNIVPVQLGQIRPAEPTAQDVNNVCARLGVATVSDEYRPLAEASYWDAFSPLRSDSDMCRPQTVLQAVTAATENLQQKTESFDLNVASVLEPILLAAELQEALQHYFYGLVSHPDLQTDMAWLEAFILLPYEREGSRILASLENLVIALMEDEVRFAQAWYVGQGQCLLKNYADHPSWCSLAYKHGLFELDD